jgi:hypothetical protein
VIARKQSDQVTGRSSQYFPDTDLFQPGIGFEECHSKNSQAGNENSNTGKSAEDASEMFFRFELTVVIFIEKEIVKWLFRENFFPGSFNAGKFISYPRS